MKVGEFFRIVFGWIIIFIGCSVPATIEFLVRYVSGVWAITNDNPPVGLIFTGILLCVLFVVSGCLIATNE